MAKILYDGAARRRKSPKPPSRISLVLSGVNLVILLLVVSEVAAFYKDGDPGNIIIHRVVENDTASGQLTTKGDANAEADFEPVKYAECIGTVAKSFPKLGTVADAVTSKAGRTAAFCLLGAAAVSQIAANMLDRRKRRDA